MLETKTPEHLFQKGKERQKGKEEAKERGIRLMQQKNDFPRSDHYCLKHGSSTSHGGHEEEEEPNKHF